MHRECWRDVFESVDVSRFNRVLCTAIQDLEAMDDLHRNAAVLSRLIYRMKSKFRNDKGLRFMCKLEKVLTNYSRLGLKQEYMDLKSQIQMKDGMFILPSRQSLEYVLARTQGFAKLMARADDISKYTSHFFVTRMKLGQAWSIALMALATVSRIGFYAKAIKKKSYKWYSELYQCTNAFEYVGGKPWVPRNGNFELPHDLESWLSLDESDVNKQNDRIPELWQRVFRESPTKVSDDIDVTFVMFDKETDDSLPNEETDCSRLIEIVKAVPNKHISDNRLDSDIDDIGEIVTREAFESNHPPNDSSLTTKREHMNTNHKKFKKE